MKTTIGAHEHVILPELNISELDAKIDTGADSCSLHCTNIIVKDALVTFTLCDHDHPLYNGQTYTLPILKKKNVKSSNGDGKTRIFVKLIIQLGSKLKPTPVSLSDRSDLKYPLLIGKKFLRNTFLVDVSYSYLLSEKQ